ncbi:DUF3888 domain-containing protein [Clostridium sp. JNZ J1-5]
MKKVSAICISIFIILTTCSPTVFASTEGENDKLYKDFVIALVSPYVMQAVKQYYGAPKQFDLYNAKILSLERAEEESFYFKITVQIKTFESNHKPPYGIETVTLINTNKGIKILEFKHSEDSIPDSL